MTVHRLPQTFSHVTKGGERPYPLMPPLCSSLLFPLFFLYRLLSGNSQSFPFIIQSVCDFPVPGPHSVPSPSGLPADTTVLYLMLPRGQGDNWKRLSGAGTLFLDLSNSRSCTSALKVNPLIQAWSITVHPRTTKQFWGDGLN